MITSMIMFRDFTLPGLCLLALSSSVFAQDTVVTLKGVTPKSLSEMKTPQLVDSGLLIERVRQLRAGLEALIHMSEMIGEEHARRAMKAQISSIKATLESMERITKTSALIDYTLPAPLPTRRKHTRDTPASKPQTHGSRASLPSPPQSDRDHSSPPDQSGGAIKAMGSTRLSQYWSALEGAPFRDDKMSVIREVVRDQYLTTQQAELLIEGLTFSRDRRDAFVMLYPKLVDPSNVQPLYRLLDHPAHRREVERKIQQINTERRQRQAQGYH